MPSKNFESGECLTYQTAPLEELRKPGDSENCWHVYLSRKYDSQFPIRVRLIEPKISHRTGMSTLRH